MLLVPSAAAAAAAAAAGLPACQPACQHPGRGLGLALLAVASPCARVECTHSFGQRGVVQVPVACCLLCSSYIGIDILEPLLRQPRCVRT